MSATCNISQLTYLLPYVKSNIFSTQQAEGNITIERIRQYKTAITGALNTNQDNS